MLLGVLALEDWCTFLSHSGVNSGWEKDKAEQVICAGRASVNFFSASKTPRLQGQWKCKVPCGQSQMPALKRMVGNRARFFRETASRKMSRVWAYCKRILGLGINGQRKSRGQLANPCSPPGEMADNTDCLFWYIQCYCVLYECNRRLWWQ